MWNFNPKFLNIFWNIIPKLFVIFGILILMLVEIFLSYKRYACGILIQSYYNYGIIYLSY